MEVNSGSAVDVQESATEIPGKQFGEYLSESEVIQYLRLDTMPGNPRERLRTLRRHWKLPHIKQGKTTFIYKKSSIDKWFSRREK
jgi:hypothetical protein